MKIRPNGWIRSFLETQLTGLTGHIEEAGYPFDTVCWGEADYASDNENPQWWVYEQTAYWLDGMLRCAIALEDANYDVTLTLDQEEYVLGIVAVMNENNPTEGLVADVDDDEIIIKVGSKEYKYALASDVEIEYNGSVITKEISLNSDKDNSFNIVI